MNRFETWGEIQNRPIRPVEFWMDGLIPKGGKVLLFGKYGTYKTPITLNMAAAIASTRSELWGLPIQNGNVLYISADTPMPVLEPRIQRCDIRDTNLVVYNASNGLDLLDPNRNELDREIYSELQAAHRNQHYDVVFIDSLRCIHKLPDKDSDAPLRVYTAVERLFPDASLVFVHHDRKTSALEASAANADEVDKESFSGSQAWINHATVGIKIKGVNQDKREIKLQATKSQAGELMPGLLLVADSDGINIELATLQKAGLYAQVVASAPVELLGHELDEWVAKQLGIGPRTARRYRLQK